jgi:hypothetical protein
VVKHDDLVAWLRIDGDLWSDSLRLIGEDPLPAPPRRGPLTAPARSRSPCSSPARPPGIFF